MLGAPYIENPANALDGAGIDRDLQAAPEAVGRVFGAVAQGGAIAKGASALANGAQGLNGVTQLASNPVVQRATGAAGQVLDKLGDAESIADGVRAAAQGDIVGAGLAAADVLGAGSSATRRSQPGERFQFNNGGCFVAGTLVHVFTAAESVQQTERERRLALGGDAATTVATIDETRLVAIEEVPLGARIATRNPDPNHFPTSLESPDSDGDVEVHLQLHRHDGKPAEARLLRPAGLVRHLRAGDTVRLHTTELETTGYAEVLSISPFSAGHEAPGNRVVGRFVTYGLESIARVTLSRGEPIEGTPIHPVWSVSRGEFVPLAELTPGEELFSESGPVFVEQVEVVSSPQPVYNIEVENEHVYQIGTGGVLVHNTDPECPELLQIDTSKVQAANPKAVDVDAQAPNTGNKIPNSQLQGPPPKRGRAPIGDDGHPVELHHRDQLPDSPLDEMTRTDHRLGENFRKNHSNTGQQPSQIDRQEFRDQRREYWEEQFDSGRFDELFD